MAKFQATAGFNQPGSCLRRMDKAKDRRGGLPPPSFAPLMTADRALFDKLEKLNDLRKKEIISAEEFEAQKIELL